MDHMLYNVVVYELKGRMLFKMEAEQTHPKGYTNAL